MPQFVQDIIGNVIGVVVIVAVVVVVGHHRRESKAAAKDWAQYRATHPKLTRKQKARARDERWRQRLQEEWDRAHEIAEAQRAKQRADDLRKIAEFERNNPGGRMTITRHHFADEP